MAVPRSYKNTNLKIKKLLRIIVMMADKRASKNLKADLFEEDH